MIALARDRKKSVVPKLFQGEKRLELAQKLLPKLDGSREFDSKKWKQAKKHLIKESHGKCAYCEADTTVVAHGDVEHFRPKSVYWWLAYCYDNFLFACQICNQTYKSDNFPVRGTVLSPPQIPDGISAEEFAQLVSRASIEPVDEASGMPYDDFFRVCKEEDCDLLNPYFDNPEEKFSWEVDDVLKTVTISAKEPQFERYVQAARAFYGFDREELKSLRYSVYQDIDTFREILGAETISEDLKERVRTRLQAHLSPEAQFAAMSRYFVREKWQLEV